MDNKNLNQNVGKNKDIYFSNETEEKKPAEKKAEAKPAQNKDAVKKAKAKAKGIGSTYMFFIIVIVCSMASYILCVASLLA